MATSVGDGADDTPFNLKNVLLSVADVAPLLLEYHVNMPNGGVRDINLYRKAMTHRSYCTRKNENFIEGNVHCPDGCIPLQEESNERLEYLGDAVLNLIVAGYLYDRFPDDNEGFLTKMRTKLVNGGMLAQLCGLCGLATWIIVSKQVEENAGRSHNKILEDTFEAFLGAMYLDQGYEHVRTWLINFIEGNVDFTELIKQQTNYKDMLAKYFQHSFNCLPRFVDVTASSSVDGGGARSCTVCIKNRDDVIIGTARAANKKLAENEAAKRALEFYGQL